MTINRISRNERLSGAVTFKDLVFLSGQVPDEGQDVATQTHEVLAKVDALLAQAGSDKDHLLNATIYLKDINADFAGMNAVWDTWLPKGVAPARATVEAKLCEPEILVELSVVAALP
jgi:enamine deaminase RidA (YjgF/YER057c/UK114 family)